MNMKIKNTSLRPSERRALTQKMSLLLVEFGNLLKVHPEMRSKLSPESGDLLIKIGKKLGKLA